MRRLEALGEISIQGKPLNGLFRLLENPIVWHEAYANDGAITPGTNKTTLDGFSEKRVMSIIV
jgi:RNA-directed DNA polymerase